MKIIYTILLSFIIGNVFGQYDINSDLQVSNMGHFKGWQTNSLTGLGLDIGISNNAGYIMAYNRSNSIYHDVRIKAVGGYNKGITLNSNGNIGVDNDNPNAKLTVNGGDLQVSNMGHFKGWQTNSLTGLGLDIGISNNAGYIMAYDRSNSTYHDVRIKAVGGYNKGITLSTNGNIGIDNDNPDAKLAVNGTVHAKEVKVDLNGWPDFVFKKVYPLPTLKEVETHIKENGHLKDIPSEAEVKANGINLGEMDAKLLQKIEELTLYVIELKKENERIEKEKNQQIKTLIKRIETIENN